MPKYIFLLIISFNILHAYILKRNYTTNTNIIYASNIIPYIKHDFIITQYSAGQHKITLSSYKLKNIFNKHDYKLSSHVAYVTFTQKSPIDMSKIIQKLRMSFLHRYPNLDIISLKVMPMSYMSRLPDSYTVTIPNYALLNNYSTIYIITPRHREFFFNFILKAKINIVVATKKIKRHTKLTAFNTKEKFVNFKNFHGMPIASISNHQYQSKFTIQSGQIILQRNIQPLSLVRRGHNVTATLNQGGISIIFSAKALQSGRKGDTINIVRDDGKELKAVIIGPNMVEIQ